MSLNKYMHPRNRYKYKKPDFDALAEKYPEFKQYVIDNPKGKPLVDFKNPDSVRALTICLLQEDFGAKVELPPDRLVPTLPLRLNYVHWIEDITSDWGRKELYGIDIGTGACCVYPVLAISGNPWRFLATEADDVNFTYAKRNMESNHLTDKINVVKVPENTILESVIGSNNEKYDFCMCNPPFFADHFEAQGLLSRTPNRPDPKTMSTASPQEGIAEGGEVGFVKKMIEESVFLQDRVRVYSSMLGKKASLGPLKEILRRHQVPNFGVSEFCQGKTMRWGLAWTFDKSVKFLKSEFAMGKKEVKKSVVHVIPTAMGEWREQVYDLASFLKQIFSELQIHCREGKQTKHFALMTLTAAENTWIHSRRKRRQKMREAAETVANDFPVSASVTAADKTVSSTTVSSDAAETSMEEMPEAENAQADPFKELAATEEEVTDQDSSRKRKAEEHENGRPADKVGEGETGDGPSLKRPKLEGSVSEDVAVPNGSNSMNKAVPPEDTSPKETDATEDTCMKQSDSRPPAQFVLKCHATVRVQGPDLVLELTWLGGENIQLLHQLMQCVKNHLAARKNNP